MRPIICLLLVGILAVALPVGAAEVKDTVDVAAFHRVRIEGMADVVLQRGDKESVVVTVPGRQRKDIQVEVVEGELRIRANTTHESWWSSWMGSGRKTPRLRIVYRALDAIDLAGAVKLRAPELKASTLTIVASGASTVDVFGIAADRLRVDGAGAMKARLAGRVVAQQVAISGAGKYDASALTSDDAEVEVSGAGSVAVHADKTLKLNVSGAASVRYHGNPEVTRHVTGAATIRHS